MTDRDYALIEKLLDTQKEMLETLRALAEAQYTIVEALTPTQVFISGPDEPPTLQ